MKKLCTIIFTLLLSFTLCACGSSNPIDEKALDQFETSMNKVSEMKAAYYAATLNMKTNENTVDLSLNGAFKNDPLNFNLKVGMSSVTDGEETKYDNLLSVAMDDKYTYMNLMDFMKSKTPVGEMKEELPDTKEAFKLDREEFKKYLTKASLKNGKVHFEFDGEKLSEGFKNILKDEDFIAQDPTGMLDVADDYENISFKNAILDIDTKDDMPTDVTFSVNMENVIDGVTNGGDITIRLSFSDVNGDVKVEMPSDADSYELMDDSASFLE